MRDTEVRDSLLITIAACLAITWLNAHVYLDTVVLLGSVANSHTGSRWWFGVGAVAASALWLSLLGFGARWLRPLFARLAAWQNLDVVIAMVMSAMAAALVARL